MLSLSRGRIARDLRLSDVQMGLVFGAFTLAYALCEIPSGFLGDRSGPRRVMLRISLWWAAFMAATGRTAGFASLYASQLIFWGGVAGVYPSVARSFATFLQPRERARAQGLIWLGARWGGAATPIVMAVLFSYFTWRGAFTALSFLGVIWAAGFLGWFPRDAPPALSATRPRIPWGAVARSKTIWLLCAQYFALIFSWYFLVSWVPAFIDERFHPSVAAGAVLKVLPLFFGGLGALSGGLVSAPLARRLGSLGLARQTLACVGFAGAAGFLALAATCRTPLGTVLSIALSSYSNDLIMPTCWGTAADVAGPWSGTVSAIMNMVGNVGGAIYGFTAGVLLSATHHNWNLLLYLGAAVYSTGILAWLALDPERHIEL